MSYVLDLRPAEVGEHELRARRKRLAGVKGAAGAEQILDPGSRLHLQLFQRGVRIAWRGIEIQGLAESRRSRANSAAMSSACARRSVYDAHSEPPRSIVTALNGEDMDIGGQNPSEAQRTERVDESWQSGRRDRDEATFRASRALCQPDAHARDHAKIRLAEQSVETRTDTPLGEMGHAAPGKDPETGPQYLPVRQHRFEPANRSGAVTHAEAAIERVADDARAGACIRRLEPPPRGAGHERSGELSLRDARLDHGIAKLGVDLEDAVDIAKIENHLPGRDRTCLSPAPILAAADGIQGHAVVAGDPHESRQLLCAPRPNNGEHPRCAREGGACVAIKHLRVGPNAIAAQQSPPLHERRLQANRARRGDTGHGDPAARGLSTVAERAGRSSRHR